MAKADFVIPMGVKKRFVSGYNRFLEVAKRGDQGQEIIDRYCSDKSINGFIRDIQDWGDSDEAFAKAAEAYAKLQILNQIVSPGDKKATLQQADRLIRQTLDQDGGKFLDSVNELMSKRLYQVEDVINPKSDNQGTFGRAVSTENNTAAVHSSRQNSMWAQIQQDVYGDDNPPIPN